MENPIERVELFFEKTLLEYSHKQNDLSLLLHTMQLPQIVTVYA